MTAEVEEKTEADWAMLYAEERKLRMKCQDRLAAFMINAPALANVAKDLVFQILETNNLSEALVKDMVRVIKDSNDMIGCINYNIFDPVWEISDKERARLQTATCHEDIEPGMIERLSNIFMDAGKAQDEQWHDMCHAHDLKCPDQLDNEDREHFEALFSKRVSGPYAEGELVN